MQDGDKRCSCGAGCPTFGACMRGKRLTLDLEWQNRHDFWAENDHYRKAVEQGMEPDGVERADVDRAIRWSDKNGVAYDGNAR